MEETLGKRIAAHRRRLGLTQEGLAEKMGITAQAVSKWENDQSCPDITALPKLAEIFGVTTDALLGLQPPVKEAEVVEDGPGLPVENNDNLWEFHWDAGRKGSLGFAMWVLLVGVILLINNIQGMSAQLWDVAWSSGLLFFGLWGLWPRFSFFKLGCALFGGYFLINHLIPDLFVLEKAYLLPIFLLLFGFSLLVDALKRGKRGKFRVMRNGQRVSSHPQFTTGEASFDYSLSFAEHHQELILPKLSSGSASVSFGELTLDLSGVEEITDGCMLNLDCSFGELRLLVPRQYRVETFNSTSFASVECHGHPDPEPKAVIHANCNANFGEIDIRYIN